MLVVFDVGETIVDESRVWLRRAAQIGVPPFTFLAVLGGAIRAGRGHGEAFELLGVDTSAFLAARDAAADPADGILAVDLYPDVVPTLDALVRAGHEVAVAANQPGRAAAELARLGLPLRFVLTSAELRVAKPSPAFFEHLLERAGRPPAEVTYVGDRLDNDIEPALAAGLRAVLVRRGPWGVLHASQPGSGRATAVIDSLLELPDLLGGPGAGPGPPSA